MKKKSMAVIGMVVCFMMTATMAWSAGIPGVPDGTVTVDNLVWLQNADCFGRQNWDQAMSSAASLKSGSCGLKDGSTAGQWRLPTRDELQYRRGDRRGFNNVQSTSYWSSSVSELDTDAAWILNVLNGREHRISKDDGNYVWPVRARQ